MGKADIYQVAKAAGVSISTVSRAFTRPELVSRKTRHKVLEVADKLDFNISRSATALKSGQTYRVAMLMNEEITSWFNTQTFAGIESVMHPAGYDISLFQHIDTAANRHEFFTELPIRRNVDAVFVASFAIDPHEVEQLQRIHVPIIGINTPSSEGFDATISIDDEKGMYTATQHLINLGHRHIVYPCSEAAGLDSSIDARPRLHPRLRGRRRPPRHQLAGAFGAARPGLRRLRAVRAAGVGQVPGRHLLPDGYDGDSAGAQAGAIRAPHTARLLDRRL